MIYYPGETDKEKKGEKKEKEKKGKETMCQCGDMLISARIRDYLRKYEFAYE